MSRNYFDARIAKGYESKWPEIHDPSAIEPPFTGESRAHVSVWEKA
jgi:hypothetical protein